MPPIAPLERLCRYILRPIISADHLTLRPDGRVEYRFRRPDPTGRTSWVTDGPTRCGDRLRVLAFLTHPDVTALILDHLGLASAGPPVHRLAHRPRTTFASSLALDDR